MTDWHDKPTVLKGDAGEAVLDSYLKGRGVMAYQPVFNGAHPFDRLCASMDKKTLFIAEAKNKPRRAYYPDTGINASHYNDYVHIMETYHIDVWISFIDEKMKQMYGNFLSVLIQDCEVIIENAQGLRSEWYPKHKNGIVYFPLISMIKMADLSEIEVATVSKHSTRKREYDDAYELSFPNP